MRAINIETTISRVRLHRFVSEAGKPTQALRLYRWNAQVASAYWTPLHFVEVAVRNTVHDALTERFAKESWFERAPGVGADWLYPDQRDAVEKAFAKIHHPVTAGKVVAELPFGFWVALLSGRYVPPPRPGNGADYHDVVWVKGGVSRRFGGAKRGVIFKRLDRLRRFRNRIAHHEHLMGENLDLISADVDSVLTILNSDMATWVRAVSNVAQVRASRPC